MKGGSDGDDDDDDGHGGDGARVSGLEMPEPHRRAEGWKLEVPCLPLVWVLCVRKPLVPWSEAFCCEYAVPEVEAKKDGTMKPGAGRVACRTFSVLHSYLSPPTWPYASGNEG